MQRKKILVVDDDPISLRIIEDSLQSAGFQTEKTQTGEQAWGTLNKDPDHFVLAIVDRMMVGVDGMELVRRIKASEQLRHIPVIMQTGEAEPEDYVKAVEAGVFDFIYKPIEHELLLYLVNMALKDGAPAT